jgi:hypothetical protein
MSELRRTLLDDSDAPPELSPDLAFLAARNAAVAALLLHHAEGYRSLYERYRREGPSPEIEEIALDAAGGLATVMQSLRRRGDLLLALEQAPDLAGPPLIIIDQLYFSLLLMTGPDAEVESEMCLSVAALDELMANNAVQKWLKELEA